MPSLNALLRASLVALVASLYGPYIYRMIHVFGVFRKPVSTPVEAGNLVVIDDTIHCEDLHIHDKTGLIFTTCEDDATTRYSWFPGLGLFEGAATTATSRGSIHIIDPKTLKSQRLEFENFDGPFITHGIDILSDPKDPDGVYIYAINHLANRDYLSYLEAKQEDSGTAEPANTRKAGSRLEVFHYRVGSPSVRHLRSIEHPLIKTPNDIIARTTTSLYVTNDHHYPEGNWRLVEDLYYGAKWSDTIHIEIGDLTAREATAGIEAKVVLTGLHNNNGLGRGVSPDEIVIGSATSGDLHIAQVLEGTQELKVLETISLDTAIDNPSYFKDPYSAVGHDASGHLTAGLSTAHALPKAVQDPTMKIPATVWYVKPQTNGDSRTWEKKVVFEDDGSRISSASSTVLVAIDPELEGGKKRGWLFVTGFVSANVIAVKIDL